MFWLYLIIGFVTFFFTYKIREEKIKESIEYSDLYIEASQLWITLGISVFWIITLPSILAWKLLEFLTRGIFKKRKSNF